jgi:hypothetical protein
MLRRLPAWSIRSTSNRAASSRRRIIIIAIIAVLLAAIIAVPIIMALLAQPITVVIITIIGVLTMAVFIIAIIVVLLAVLIVGVITETVGVALGWSRAHTRGQSLSTMNQSPAHWGFFLGAATRDDRRSPQASADPFRGAAWFARRRTFPLIA